MFRSEFLWKTQAVAAMIRSLITTLFLGGESAGEYLVHQLLRQILSTNHVGAWTFQESIS